MMPSMRLIGLLLCTVVAATTVGCGYALVGKASNLPEDVQSVYIHPLRNATSRSQVEQLLTEAITNELVTRQRLRVVSREEADSELLGIVTGFLARPVSFGGGGRATQYEVILTVRIDFRRTGDDRESLWSNDRYQFRENYELDISTTAFFDREDTAIIEVADNFAQTLVTDMLEGF